MNVNYEYDFKMPQDYKSSGAGYPGQDFQAVITNTPNSWIIRTSKAF